MAKLERQNIYFSVTQKTRNENYSMPSTHYHAYYELYYLLEGERLYFIENRTYPISKGTLVLIDRYAIHRTLNAKSPHHTKYMIQVHPEYMKQLHPLIKDLAPLSVFSQSHKILPLDVIQQRYVEDIFETLIRENNQEAYGAHQRVAIQFLDLLIFIQRALHMPVHEPSSTNTLHSKVPDIIRYINDHYDHLGSLGNVAETFFISPNYLCKIFKDYTGFTYNHYLNQVRIRAAEKLLRETKDNMTSIALQVGYGTLTHFGRVFRQITGLTPMQYRKYHKC